MRKRIVSLVLAVCLLCGLLSAVGPVARAEEYKGLCGEDVRWVLDTGKKELRISGTGPMVDYDTVAPEAPWRKYVTSIESLVIEPGVTEIGACAFYQLTNLKTASLPDTVVAIWDDAFSWNSSLEECNIPSQIVTIGDNAFYNCDSLTTVILPDTLTELGEGAFGWSSSITTVRIPGSVKDIPKNAFAYDNALASLTLEEGIETIGEGSFLEAEKITHLVIPSTVTELGEDAFWGCKSLETVNMKCDNVKLLPDSLFRDCTALKRIKLPQYLEKVGNSAFSDCTSLVRIDYPATTTAIGWKPHCDNSNLKVVTFAGNNIKFMVGDEEVDLDYGGDEQFGIPGVAILFSTSPSIIKDYAIKYGHDWQPLGSEPEDGWDPNAEPTPTPDPTQKPSPTPGPSGDEPADRFHDVSATHYARNAINWAVANKITGGMATNLFGVGKNCDRSQAVFFIWAAEGRPEPSLTQNPFVDVSSSAYYYKAVLWAKEKGVTGGKSATTFDPTGNVTRGQIMTFLYAAQGKPAVSGSKNFSDVKLTDYYNNAVAWAAENGVSSGKGAGTFKPKDNCKREEIVTFLYQAYK